MTTHLYFIRHGETDLNRDGIMQGRSIDPPINATGRAQARALASHLADVSLDAIYTSPMQRTRQTAAALSEQHPDVPVRAMKDLEEMSWGVYEGQARDSEAVEGVYDMLYDHWGRGDFERRVQGGESVVDVQTRGMRAVEHIVDQHAGDTVAVVTHGRFLRIILSSLLDDYGLERMNDIPHDNACLNHLTVRSGTFALELLNSTDHLTDLDVTVLD